MQNIIEKTLLDFISQENAVFVFPTQVSAERWADRIISIGAVTAVAMERFIAWDQFKGNSIRSQHQDKRSVPSLMRNVFAAQLISENAKTPFLKELIVPEYSKDAKGFKNWITGLLPGLSLWKSYAEKLSTPLDNEDQDLMEIYSRYKAFLDKNNLFDPAWETPPFEADGNHYFIIFPEILSDYVEYEKILEASPADITIVHIPEEILNEKSGTVDFFDNSRTEIKNVALYLRKLHQENNIPWTDIALSVPDMESYGPYIERELELYQIPYVSRNAKPLSSTNAGAFFSQINTVYANDFSFESLKSLLLNDSLPWKNTNVIFQLIDFGKKNNCICNYQYKGKKVDVWAESLAESRGEELVDTFYKKLKNSVTALIKARSFKDIRKFYFEFRNDFFDMNLCSYKTDRIISRCISELAGLIDLENEFAECRLENPFGFFTEVLSKTNYLEQTTDLGVALIPYKLSATAPYAIQIVVDASQAGLSVVYKELSFLREDKRKILFGNREDPNVTDLFIRLYGLNSTEAAPYFTSSNKTFTGYAQATSYLSEINFADSRKTPEDAAARIATLSETDMYKAEKSWLSGKNSVCPEKITSIEKNGFEFWKNSQKMENSDLSQVTEKISELVKSTHFYKNGILNISASNLKRFFNCPRSWLIEKIGNLEEQDNNAELVDHKMLGLLYHRFFELFCGTLKEKSLAFSLNEDGTLPEEYKILLDYSLNKALELERNPFLARQLLESTRDDFYATLSGSVTHFFQLFNGCLVAEIEKDFSYQPEGKNYICAGRIDCLLVDPTDGELFLVDFKSFDSAIPDNLFADPEIPAETPLNRQELPDFQMPMYLYLMKNQSFPRIVENVCFFQVSKGEIYPVFGESLYARMKALSPGMRKKPVTAEEFEATMEKFISCLDYFEERLEKCDFEISPAVQDFEQCNACGNRALCRRTFNISRQD